MRIPLKIKIIAPKPSKEYKEVIEFYRKRLKNLTNFEFLSQGLPKDAILLDPEGKELSSEDFLKMLKNSFGREICFAVGDARGFPAEIKRTHKKISLSRLTFQHDLAHLILLEQLYRALLKLKGVEYEK